MREPGGRPRAPRRRREDRDLVHAYLPDLASSLNNYSGQLAAVGRHTEALPPIEEAVKVYRDLAEAAPDAYLPALARSLITSAYLIVGDNRSQQLIQLILEAVEISDADETLGTVVSVLADERHHDTEAFDAAWQQVTGEPVPAQLLRE